MPCKIGGGKILGEAVISFAFLVSDGRFVDIDSVFFREILDYSFDCLLLFGYDRIRHKIAHDTHSDRTLIVPEGMCCDIIIPPCATLVDLPALPDEIVVPDIAPPADDGVVVVDPADECKIVFVGLIVLCGMMDDDPLHLFGFLDGPYEGVTVFSSGGLDGLVLLRKIGGEMGPDGLNMCLILESGIGFRLVLICFPFCKYRLPLWAVGITKRLVCSPIGSLDNTRASGSRFRRSSTESHMETSRIGIESHDGYCGNLDGCFCFDDIGNMACFS